MHTCAFRSLLGLFSRSSTTRLSRPVDSPLFQSPPSAALLSDAVTMAGADVLQSVAEVQIDDDGTFKYILMRIQVPGIRGHRDIVRGFRSAEFHNVFTLKYFATNCSFGSVKTARKLLASENLKLPVDHIFEKVNPELESLGLESTCLGGGKIEHNSKEKKIRIFGESTGYGKADHSVTAEKLKKVYTDYFVTWTDGKK